MKFTVTLIIFIFMKNKKDLFLCLRDVHSLKEMIRV